MRSMSGDDEAIEETSADTQNSLPGSSTQPLDGASVVTPEKTFDFAGFRDSGKPVTIQLKNGKTAAGTVMMFNDSEVVLDAPAGIKNIARSEILDVTQEE